MIFFYCESIFVPLKENILPIQAKTIRLFDKMLLYMQKLITLA